MTYVTVGHNAPLPLPGTSMICDVLLALVDRDQLTSILPAVHQHALGHVARVLDAGRGDITSQLRRAGVPVTGAPEAVLDASLLLMISAAGRCPSAARLLMRSGIDRSWIVARNGAWQAVDDSVLHVAPVGADASGQGNNQHQGHVPVPGMRDRAIDRLPDAAFLADAPPGEVERDDSAP